MLVMPCYKFVSVINRHAVRHEVVRKLLTGYASSRAINPPCLRAICEKTSLL